MIEEEGRSGRGKGERRERREVDRNDSWKLTASLAFGSAPFSSNFSSCLSNPPAHTAHRIGRPEPSWKG